MFGRKSAEIRDLKLQLADVEKSYKLVKERLEASERMIREMTKEAEEMPFTVHEGLGMVYAHCDACLKRHVEQFDKHPGGCPNEECDLYDLSHLA